MCGEPGEVMTCLSLRDSALGALETFELVDVVRDACIARSYVCAFAFVHLFPSWTWVVLDGYELE